MIGKLKKLTIQRIVRLLNNNKIRCKGSTRIINEKKLMSLNQAQKVNIIKYDNEIVILDDLNQKNLSTMISTD